MEKEKNKINETIMSNSQTLEYYNNVTRSIINQTPTDLGDTDYKLEKEAHIFVKKAEHKLRKRCCLFTLFSSKQERFTIACEYYRKAGNIFKVCNQWRKAGLCYENCALIKIKLKEKPTNFYRQAYNCFEKIDIDDKHEKILKDFNDYLEKGKEYFEIGKNYENLAVNKENKKKYSEAIANYTQAIIYYEKDGKNKELKNNLQLKLAELMMSTNDPDAPKKVPALLENVGVSYLNDSINKNASKDCFGKAILCNIYFEDNPAKANVYINKYKAVDKTFGETNICKLCCDIVNSMENNDYSKLNTSILHYKEVEEVDEFMAEILDKIIEKAKIKYNIRESLSYEKSYTSRDEEK